LHFANALFVRRDGVCCCLVVISLFSRANKNVKLYENHRGEEDRINFLSCDDNQPVKALTQAKTSFCLLLRAPCQKFHALSRPCCYTTIRFLGGVCVQRSARWQRPITFFLHFPRQFLPLFSAAPPPPDSAVRNNVARYTPELISTLWINVSLNVIYSHPTLERTRARVKI
jgi:hypothetical protein